MTGATERLQNVSEYFLSSANIFFFKSNYQKLTLIRNVCLLCVFCIYDPNPKTHEFTKSKHSFHPPHLTLSPSVFPEFTPLRPPPPPTHTQAHARQINLRGLDWWHHGPLCWLRCCQKWWVIGKLCSAATLTAGCWCTLSMLIFSCCHSGTTQHASVTRRHSEWQQVSPPEWRMRPVDLRLQLFWSIILTSTEKH